MTGCPVAKAYDVKPETPEGWVSIEKKSYHHEGKKITCPTWLVEPT